MDVIDFIILFLDGSIVIKSHGVDQDMKKSRSYMKVMRPDKKKK